MKTLQVERSLAFKALFIRNMLEDKELQMNFTTVGQEH
jgi:hypothetical protein